MNKSHDTAGRKNDRRGRRLAGLIWKIAAVIIVVVGAFLLFRTNNETRDSDITFEARRGNLRISVLEGGDIEALESQQVRSRVRGREGAKILSIVEEGYRVTEEDVKNGKVLVELDSSELVERLIANEIEVTQHFASLRESQQNYAVQLSENESRISAAEQSARFAFMDLEKYLGSDLTEIVLDEMGLEKDIDKIGTIELPSAELELTSKIEVVENIPGAAPDPGANPHGAREVRTVPEDNPAVPKEENGNPDATSENEFIEMSVKAELEHVSIPDFAQYADPQLLGDGQAKQAVRDRETQYIMAQAQLKLTQIKLEGIQRLYEKEYRTKSELDQAELEFEKGQISVDSAETSRGLVMRYDFPMQAEKLLLTYRENLWKLERAKMEAISKTAQASAKLKGAERRYVMEKQHCDEQREQIEYCIIRAERPGLVVYGGNSRGWRGEDPIREGTTVRERQQILTIPDMTEMSVKVKVHETEVNKVAIGQNARITVEAYADAELTGEVMKVGVLPASEDRWMNPDVKVYPVTIKIDGVHEWLRPNMTAEVEILVKELEDVVHVPINAITPYKDQRVCYVLNGGEPERREVETGEFNQDFIEIKSGIAEGEEVLLDPPDESEEEA